MLSSPANTSFYILSYSTDAVHVGWKTLETILEMHGSGARPQKRASTTTVEANALKRFRGLDINGGKST